MYMYIYIYIYMCIYIYVCIYILYMHETIYADLVSIYPQPSTPNPCNLLSIQR